MKRRREEKERKEKGERINSVRSIVKGSGKLKGNM